MFETLLVCDKGKYSYLQVNALPILKISNNFFILTHLELMISYKQITQQ